MITWGLVTDLHDAGHEKLGIALKQACLHTKDFAGARRRMELLCCCSAAHFMQRLCKAVPATSSTQDFSGGGSVHIYDDYAHHPTEIAATLSAVHAKHAAVAVIAVWQPISRGRLTAFMSQFCTELRHVAGVIIAPMDTSREVLDPEADATLVHAICDRLNEVKPEQPDRAHIAYTSEDIIHYIHSSVFGAWQGSPGTDIAVLFMGSGNITCSAHTVAGLIS